MVTAQTLRQIGALPCNASPFDGMQGHVFNDHVRCHHDAGADRLAAGVQQGDAGAIRMTQQHRSFDAAGLQQRGQHVPGLAVHVVGQAAVGASYVGDGL